MYAKWNKNSGGGGGSTTTYFYFAIEKVDTQDGHALNAATVRNYRGSTPELLNGEDHFAYIVGHNDGNVYPNGLISRAETAAVFFRLLKDEVRDGNLLTSNTYSDVPDDYWANTAISTMTGLGIVQGHSGTTFDPEAPITRAQFAAICARFDTGAGGTTQTFSDISGHWAEEYIRQVAGLGWIKGFEDGTFRPDTYITRAQAMTMINRVLNRIPEENSDLPAGMNTWPDCNPGDWFYDNVMDAAENGYISGMGDGTFNPTGATTRAQFASMIANAMGYEADPDVASMFPDVADDFWGKAAINFCAQNGIITGYDDGTFQPNKAITRQEAASILRNAFKLTESSSETFPDDSAISGWAKESVYIVKASGLMKGDAGTGNFRPTDTIIRAEAASILMNAKYAGLIK